MLRTLLLLFFSLWQFASYANNDCADATPLTPGTSCSSTVGSFNGATITGAAPTCAIESLQDVWFKFTATDVTNGIYLNPVSNLNHGLEIRQGGCNGTVVACRNDYFAGYGESYFSNNFVVGQEYYIRVFNATAQLTTVSFTICVMKFPTPANDLCTAATQLIPGTTCNNTSGTFSGTLMDGGTPSCAVESLQDVWFKFTATDVTNGIYLNPVSNLNHGLEIREGGCNGTVVACRNDYFAGYGESYFSNNFVVGQEYYIRVFNATAQLTTASFTICVMKFPTPANDLCTAATQLTPGSNCTFTTGTFSGSLKDGGVPSCASNASQDVWYRFTATDVTMSVYVSDVQYLNHGFEIYQGGCSGTLVACKNDYNFDGYGENYFNNNFIVGQEYYIRVFNASNVLTTRSFNICVTKYPTPGNDLCTDATQLTPGSTCTFTTGTFSGSLKDGGVPSCAPNASQDVWYRFTATDVTMSVYVSDVQYLNHGFEIYQGGCSGTLVACKNDYNFDGYGENYFNNNFIVGQEYYIRVFNASNVLTTRSFNICVTKYPTPGNDLCTDATQLTPGSTCSFTTGTFSGSLKDGGVPSCAPNASQDVWYRFTATDVTMSVYVSDVQYLNHGFEIYQGGCSGTLVACKNDYNFDGYGENYFNNNFIVGQEYYIRVFNASNVLTTRSFNICVTKYPTPGNDLCTDATQLTPGSNCTFTTGTFSGSLKDGGVPSCAPNASQDVWYRFTATDVTMSVYVSDVQYLNHGFEIYQGGCSGTLVACKNDYNFDGYGESYFNNNFIVGQEYYIRVFNASNILTTRSFNICVTKYPTPGNDLCTDATQLTPGSTCSFTTGTFSGSLKDGGVPSCAPNASQDVWYRFTATATTMSVSLSSIQYLNHGFEIYLDGCNGALVSCKNDYNFDGYGENYTGNSFIIGQEYYVRVFNASAILQTRNFGICLIGPPPVACTPSVAISASTASICQGQSVTFTAAPTNGGSTPSYQWKVGNTNVGTNSPTYTTTTLGNGNVVSVVMTSNAVCASVANVTSNTIIMDVTTPLIPVFTQAATICPGGSFTLPTTSNNGITGTWSPAINNTATTTYTFTPNAGQCATATTMTVTVSSNINPGFTQIATICPGGSFTLPTTSNNGITGTWSPAVNNTTTTTYTFTPTSGQCASTAVMTVSVTNMTTPNFTQIATICPGDAFTLPTTSTNGITGTWSPEIDDTATTTYTFTPTAGQCATTVTMTVSVNSGITPAFTQIAAICTGSSFSLPAISNNSITGTWSPAVNTTATTTYTFTPVPGQCAVTTTMTVTVNSVTTPVFTQIAPVCEGDTFILPAMSNNGFAGTWSPAVNSNSTTTYTFTPNTGQCVATATMTVSVTNIDTSVTVFGNSIIATTPSAEVTYQWINCGTNQPIIGEISSSYFAAQDGSYAVIITENGCSKTSECTVIAGLGIKPVEKTNWKVYPIPSTDILFVDSDEATGIFITDMTGKTVARQLLKSGQNSIDVAGLSSGVYTINSDSGIHIKFIKK